MLPKDVYCLIIYLQVAVAEVNQLKLSTSQVKLSKIKKCISYELVLFSELFCQKNWPERPKILESQFSVLVKTGHQLRRLNSDTSSRGCITR